MAAEARSLRGVWGLRVAAVFGGADKAQQVIVIHWFRPRHWSVSHGRGNAGLELASCSLLAHDTVHGLMSRPT